MQSTIALLLSVNSGFAKKKFQPRGRISNKIELLSHAAKLVFFLFDLRSFPDKELHFIYISYLTHCGWTYFQMVGIVSGDLFLGKKMWLQYHFCSNVNHVKFPLLLIHLRKGEGTWYLLFQGQFY